MDHPERYHDSASDSAAATFCAAAPPSYRSAAAGARRTATASDPVPDLWQEWRALHAELDAWQDDRQKKEGVLPRTVGMPRVLVPVPGQAEPVSACEPAEIDELLEDLPGTEALRQRLHREFAAHRRRWEIAAGRSGSGPVDERVNTA